MQDCNISNRRTVTLYTQWTAFCIDLQLNHLLEDPNIPYVDILQVYGHRVFHSHSSSQSNRLKADLVATAWRDIANTHLLEGRHDPRKTHYFHTKDLDKCLTKMLRHFSYQEPPPKREKATPLGLVMVSTEAADPACPFVQRSNDLIQIALFFCP